MNRNICNVIIRSVCSDLVEEFGLSRVVVKSLAEKAELSAYGSNILICLGES